MHSEYYDNTNRGDEVLTCWRRLLVVILKLTHFQVFLSEPFSDPVSCVTNQCYCCSSTGHFCCFRIYFIDYWINHQYLLRETYVLYRTKRKVMSPYSFLSFFLSFCFPCYRSILYVVWSNLLHVTTTSYILGLLNRITGCLFELLKGF